MAAQENFMGSSKQRSFFGEGVFRFEIRLNDRQMTSNAIMDIVNEKKVK
jgi:hypothetical protein